MPTAIFRTLGKPSNTQHIDPLKNSSIPVKLGQNMLKE